MAFWKKRDDGDEWEQYQRTKERGGAEKPAAEEFQDYFQAKRRTPGPEDGAAGYPGEQETPLKTFLSRFRAEPDGAEEAEPEIAEVCPWCGGAMEKGYLVGPRGLYWDRKKPGGLRGISSDAVSLDGEPFSVSYRRAWSCKSCQKLTAEMPGPFEMPEAIRRTMSPADLAAAEDGAEKTDGGER